MRIFYLSPSQVPSQQANSVHVMKMCAALAAEGNTVTLFAKRGDRLDGESIHAHYGVPESFDIRPIRQLRRNRSGKALWRWKIRSAVLRHRPDLVYGRDIRGLLAMAGTGVPLVCEAHFLPERVDLYEKLFALTNFRRLVVISRALGNDFTAHYPGLDPSQIQVESDAADPAPAQNPEGPLQGAGGPLRVGYVGQLYAGKGIELIAELARRCEWAEFHVVGGCEPELSRWQGRATSSNLRFHGFVPHRETARFIASFDVVLAPYQPKVEGASVRDIVRWMSPLKLFEYMAHAKPILASDLPVLHEILEHETNALLLPPGEPERWAEALKRLADDPNRRHSLGEAALRSFERGYTWRARARRAPQGVALARDAGATSG